LKSLKEEIESRADDAEFSTGADEKRLAAAEANLEVGIPQALREFLKDADGAVCDHGTDVVWSVAKIESENLAFRSNADFEELYMPFDSLLFFADDGGGDQFAFAVHADGQIHKNDVFRWDHESDARIWFASGLSDYVARRLSKSYYDPR
jgi:hypothetical protein